MTHHKYQKIAILASEADDAQQTARILKQRYSHTSPQEADVIVAVGGDGFMLHTLHSFIANPLPIYGINRGSLGFLMNEMDENDFLTRLDNAEETIIHPLKMKAIDATKNNFEALAINEVSVFRQSYQAAKLAICVDDRQRLDELICDGVMVATPAGSTAYNLSAQGPILPLSAPLLALTPICPFRPRRWRGALLPNTAKIKITVNSPIKRPVNVVADHQEFKDIRTVEISECRSIKLSLLFDPGYALDERIRVEQFLY